MVCRTCKNSFIDCDGLNPALQQLDDALKLFFSNRSIKVRELQERAETEPEQDSQEPRLQIKSRQPSKKKKWLQRTNKSADTTKRREERAFEAVELKE